MNLNQIFGSNSIIVTKILVVKIHLSLMVPTGLMSANMDAQIGTVIETLKKDRAR